MPTYRVTLDDGRTFRITADRPPTVEEAAAALRAGGFLGEGYDSPVLPAWAEKAARAHPTAAGLTSTALRIGGPIVGGAAGTALGPFGTAGGAATGAFAGNVLGQELERAAGTRRGFSRGELAADVALAPIPGARIGRDLGVGMRVGRRALQGARFGLAQKLIEPLVDRGELPTPGEALEGAAVGGLVGGVLEGGAAALRRGGELLPWLRRAPAAVADDATRAATPAPETPPAPAEAPAAPAPADPLAPAPAAPPGAPAPDSGRTTPAGFRVAEGAAEPAARALPPERIPGVVSRFARTPEEATALQQDLTELAPEIARQSRGEIPVEETERFAAALIPPEGLPVSQALNAEEITSLYITTRTARDRLTAARLAARQSPADGDLAAAAQAAEWRYLRWLDLFAGARAESGRALGIQRRFDRGPGRDVRLAMQAMRGVRQLGEAGQLRSGVDAEALAHKVAAAVDDPATALRIIRDSVRPGWGRQARAWVYFSYLSRPATHLRNIFGNLEALIEGQAGKATAAAMGEPGVVPGELGQPLVTGARIGALQGARKVVEILRDGLTSEDLHDPDFLLRFLSGESQTELVQRSRGFALPGDPLGKRLRLAVTNAVPRALLAVDAGFRTLTSEIAAHQGAYARAHRIAMAEGLTGRALIDRRRELAADLLATMTPETDLGREVALAGKRGVFQERPGQIANALAQGLPEPTQLLFLPFIKTPANLYRRLLQKLPGVGSVSAAAEVRRQARAEGIAPVTAAAERLRAQLVGENALGYMALMPLVALAAAGVLIGESPTDEGARQRAFEQGIRENTLRVGDRLVPLSTFGPAGMTAQTVASAVQAYQRKGDAARFMDRIGAAAGAAAVSLRDVSFLFGLRELFDTGLGTGSSLKSLSRIVGRKAAGIAIPGIVQDVERVLDPTVRKPVGDEGLDVVAGEFLSRMPGLSTRVPARRGTRGEERTEPTGDTVGERILSVATGTSRLTPDPLLAELDRLAQATKGEGPGPGRFELGLGRTVRLEGESLAAWEAAQAQARGRAIAGVLARPAYATWSDARRRQEIDRAVRRAGRELRRRTVPKVRALARGERGPLVLEELR